MIYMHRRITFRFRRNLVHEHSKEMQHQLGPIQHPIINIKVDQKSSPNQRKSSRTRHDEHSRRRHSHARNHVLTLAALMGHCHAVLGIAEPMCLIAVVDNDDAEWSWVSAKIRLAHNGSYDREFEVGLADSGHAVADLVEGAVHFRAPGGFVGFVFMGIWHCPARSCTGVSLPPKKTFHRTRKNGVYERFFSSGRSKAFSSRATANFRIEVLSLWSLPSAVDILGQRE